MESTTYPSGFDVTICDCCGCCIGFTRCYLDGYLICLKCFEENK